MRELIIIVSIIVTIFVVKLFWNYVMVPVFEVNEIDTYESLGLVIVTIFFGQIFRISRIGGR